MRNEIMSIYFQSQVWQIEFFQGQFDIDLLFQDHPDSNQFFPITCSLHLKDFQCDTIYRFAGIASPKSLYIGPTHPSLHQLYDNSWGTGSANAENHGIRRKGVLNLYVPVYTRFQ